MKKTEYQTELKHIITLMDAQLIRSSIQPVLHIDPHAGPDKREFIRSLYFDTAEDKAYYEKQQIQLIPSIGITISSYIH
ncbi:hypothetical protein LLG10_01055 [bacterium]|nr:hypothetical protein [bacterium]